MLSKTTKALYHRLRNRIRKVLAAIKKQSEKPLLFAVTISFTTNIFVEILSRRSVVAAIMHTVRHPLVFLINSMIILFTMTIALYLKRKLFGIAMMSIFWLTLALGNCILLGMRTTPLAAIDLKNLATALAVIKFYLNSFQIILLIALITLIAAGIVLLWLKMPKQRMSFFRAASSTVAVGVVLVVLLVMGSKSDALGKNFDNLALAYDDYGFVYCFSYGLINSGIDCPEEYDEHEIKSLLVHLGEEAEPNVKPNIILLQLESFFDINDLAYLELTKDPTPVFTDLKNQFESGYLTVPTIGAGTVNTEFEVLTGMSLEFFAPGEYPYKTVMKEKAVESAAFILSDLGYSTGVIHNHSGFFYERHEVLPNLGFDKFTSIEYFDKISYNKIGWARDEELTDEILKMLDSTAEQDFIFTISVQGHGKYPTEVPDIPYEISAPGIADQAARNSVEYFVSQLKETDEFLGELIWALRERGEPTVLIIYGDHLPTLDVDWSERVGQSIFQTGYIIWDNMSAERADGPDLHAHQLMAYVFDKLDIRKGIFPRLHQRQFAEGVYSKALHMLEYDVLFGEDFARGSRIYKPKNMQMGTDRAEIHEAEFVGDMLYVRGEGFTQYSDILHNGSRKPTIYIDSKTLAWASGHVPDGGEIVIAQVGEGNVILSKTERYVIKNKKMPRP